ncbi:alpha/beta fold hydrolase [Flavihumibacter sp. UBA7668]|uniref:alpha/beta fold hydrolase n=1 Tax=Flavihumibacter sp. UBA7668 TaxID=1946542 RepID=UPI0025BBE81C|nr:alpha/beta fold hydrolase [Flavihumibacter sp. UBA7668]
MRTSFLTLLFILVSVLNLVAQEDHSHYSQVFKRSKSYRIYLPEAYKQEPSRRFPVVYYFHGNKGDHRLFFEELPALVKSGNAILVAWNGRSVDSDIRPYNIGYHSNINYPYEFRYYFPELVHHIDSQFRTKTDRSNRGVIGHSMGGFMSFYLAAAYPDLIGSAVNSKGSPEFFIGMPNRHTLYQHRYMFPFLRGIRLRFQTGDPGEELHYLNNEVHTGAQRTPGLVYDFQSYPGVHFLNFEQFKDAYKFILQSFANPVDTPESWSYAADVASFSAWGYTVQSTLKTPGYILLENVRQTGFTVRTQKWFPLGAPLQELAIKIKTAPRYKPGKSYQLLDYNLATGTQTTRTVKADEKGSLQIETDQHAHSFGISSPDMSADMVVIANRSTVQQKFLNHRKPTSLELHLLNRGGTISRNIQLKISTLHPGVRLFDSIHTIRQLGAGEDIWAEAAFTMQIDQEPPTDGSSPFIRFQVEMNDQAGNNWKQDLEVPVAYDVPEFKEIGVDDGDSEIFGSGNGNNIAEPGELVMIYQHSHRTRLYFDDPYVTEERLHDDLQPDKWGDGYALSSLIRIAPNCPPDHEIEFLASYEVKEWKSIKRNVHWGRFKIKVGKSDAGISTQGRVEKLPNGQVKLFWPGTAVGIRFFGQDLDAWLNDAGGKNNYYILIDSMQPQLLQTKPGSNRYSLAKGLSAGEHYARLIRLTDWFNGTTIFERFEFSPGGYALRPPDSIRKWIEFYGNSVTVGAGLRERQSSYNGPSTNQYLSYAALTARHFNAGYHCIASSGIGLTVSWGSQIMPELYNRLDPYDSTKSWDFTQSRPSLVVLNLFQNDASLVNQSDHKQVIRRFGQQRPDGNFFIQRYIDFLNRIRSHYPGVPIICTLGSMDAAKEGSIWINYIKQAVEKMNDSSIHTFFFTPIKGNGHPNPEEQLKMSAELISFIEKMHLW